MTDTVENPYISELTPSLKFTFSQLNKLDTNEKKPYLEFTLNENEQVHKRLNSAAKYADQVHKELRSDIEFIERS